VGVVSGLDLGGKRSDDWYVKVGRGGKGTDVVWEEKGAEALLRRDVDMRVLSRVLILEERGAKTGTSKLAEDVESGYQHHPDADFAEVDRGPVKQNE
jgi:hypothetical protein